MKQTIRVDGKNINLFVKNVKEWQKKGYIMVGLPITNGTEYHCIMMINYTQQKEA